MDVVKSFLEEMLDNGAFVAHQIESYNDFVQRKLQETVNDIGKITIELPTGEELYIKLGKISLGSPQVREADGSVREITPQEARLRNLTYASPLFIEMTPVFENREHNAEEVEIGEIPIMVSSVLCKTSRMTKEERIASGEDFNDAGGYFIVNGTERVLILSEEIASNKLILQKDADKVTARFDASRGGYTQRHIFERTPESMLEIGFASLATNPVPVVVLMKALGLESDKEVLDAITDKEDEMEDVFINLYETSINNKDEALEYIGKKMKIRQQEQITERVLHIIDNYLLIHLGKTPEDRIKKAKFLGIVTNNLIKLQKGKIKADDLDHYSNKRLKMSGDLLDGLFRSIIMGRWGLVARLQYNYQKMMKRGRKLLKLQSVVVSDVLTTQIMRAMATGNWVGGKTGISQRLERSNFTRTLGHLRSVVSPLSATQEHFEARELHATQWGRLCAVRTPEGQNIGLRNFLALGTQVTTASSEADETKVITALKGMGVVLDE
ncbi:DNA-directed RNA polymerase subunit B'' [archaeon]|nr:DNA-directed RNA polymerase subunit B'' [archaeon]